MRQSFWDAIAENKRKSALLFVLFFLFIMGLGWLFAYVLDFGIIGLIIAFVFATLMIFWSYYYSDKVVLKLSGAREVTHDEAPQYCNIVEALAIAAGIPKPRCYIIDDPAMNAFATGRDPEHAAVCVTTGLLKKLNRTELEGVIAHEISHIKNYDIRYMSIVALLAGFVAILSDFILRYFIWFEDRDKPAWTYALVIIAAILAPIAATLIKLAISRQREYLADASAAMLTRYPEGLASALEKIAKDTNQLRTASHATAHLFIVNPFKASKIANLFSTHPPIEERIKRLRSM